MVILAEPGTGKTEELRETAIRIRREGQAAFLCRIELLHELGLRLSLDVGTQAEFDAWIAGEDLGFVFLDSVDEARLSSRTALENALHLCASELGSALIRARIFVSCRVSSWRANADLELVSRHLPLRERDSVREYDQAEAGSDTPVTSAMSSDSGT